MNERNDPRFDAAGRRARASSGPRVSGQTPPVSDIAATGRLPRAGRRVAAPTGGRVPPQRHRPPVVASPGRTPYSSGDIPLLTHDETGATSVAKASAVALAEPPDPSGSDGQRAPQNSGPRTARKRVRRWLLALLAIALIGPFLAFVVGWFIFPVPTSDDAIKQVATFTFADGAPLATVRPENQNRVKVTLDKVPLHVKNAVLAAEDSTFYSNPGFDVTGIARAVYNQLTGGVGGGSTITQQYVKVSTGQNELTLLRKYKEVVLAVKISREQTKDQILENYLNTIYFGRGAYGIQAASQAYFGKNVDAPLTPAEGAMLAGLIQAPSRWAPRVSPDGSLDTADAERRWMFVADQMADKKFVTPAERRLMVFPDNWLHEVPALPGVPDDDKYHIYDRARAELAAQGIDEDKINTLGLTVTTTVQPARQKEAVAAVNKVMKGQPDNLRTALASVDVRTGAIIAYYGGSKGLGQDYAESLRQPGSSFKPFVLSAALQADRTIGLGSTYDGTSGQTFPGLDRPINNSGDSSDCGTQCTVKTAMTKSVNTVFYRLAVDVGPQNVIEAAHAAGIPDSVLTRQASGGIALGDQEVHPLDMAAAFGTFAGDGQRHDPYIVAKAVAADGQVLFDRTKPEDAGPPEIPQQVARNVTEAMLDVARSSNIALAGGRPVAAKTGTVQLPVSNGQNKDAWTVGFTPSISTAVWVGSDQSDAIKDSAGRAVYGRMLPGSIWKEYMDDALRGTQNEQFSKFVPMGKAPAAEPSGSGSSGAPSRTGIPRTGFPTFPDGRGNGFDPNGNGNGNGNGGNGGGDGGNRNPNNPFGNNFFPGGGPGTGNGPPARGNLGRTGPPSGAFAPGDPTG